MLENKVFCQDIPFMQTFFYDYVGILHIKPKVVYIFRGNIPQKI